MGSKPKPSSTIDAARLGFGRGESLPQIQTAPPPLYPPVKVKPVPAPLDEEMTTITDIYDRVRIEVREDAFHIRVAEEKPPIERYSDQLDEALAQAGKRYNYRKELFPSVLCTSRPKKKSATARAKEINLDKVLSEDREKEESEAAAAAAVGNQTNLEGEDAAEDGEDVDAEGGDDAEDADENVDDDYADTYFDNGENFLDPDDDALEEGAVF
ncbi:DNA-directed RNA polymerase III subunit RPC7-like [Varroa jacobsoni]|uniref:DNA-directed RNA polymerase III subunit n=1 Tax=Varroa destructor TaxID=109461 RepID=A0A7M7JYA5_VARDE|nr:DNA-directed RNA polymerase III subunit RPC7-like [Varroa destructor]XP_022652859.1 DNA-directed RNA polymerase III subunit RPC7-like [Varroa destructor]XP_022696929.1 DNA-directed RNA polymerase III subunit RPC7-like [Varroa jacobsoni]XP_022696930.1 DNA-directed RNA polymerase III subunit RPC7-like [Varroa jacobsoni]